MLFLQKTVIMGILTFILSTLAASTVLFKTLPLEETGLNVATICQDSTGNMWYGGIDCLTKYDGKRYTHFKHGPEIHDCDPDTHIYSVICSKNGQVLVAHINGLSVYNSEDLSFDSLPSPFGSVTSIIQVSENEYLVIAGRRLWIFDYERQLFTQSKLPEELLAVSASAIYNDNGDIYICSDNGNVYLTSAQFNYTKIIARINCKVNCILKDSDRLWAGTEGEGLWEVSGHPKKMEQWSTDIVKSLCLDRNGSLWVGTKNGLKILENGRFHTFHYEYYTPGSISHDSICDIFRDQQGTMWLGTYYGGVCYHSLQSTQFKSIVSKPGTNELSGNVISDIVEDRDGSLWIGTNSGGLNHMRADGLFEHISSGGDNPVDVKCIYISAATGRVYVGADRSEILVLDRKASALKPLGKGGPQNVYGCYAIVGNNRGGFFAGGSDGLYEFDEKTGYFSKLYVSDDISNIKSMMLDSQGILWIGKKYGVTALETKNGKVLELPAELSAIQYVEDFLEDKLGMIWMATDSGVYIYDHSAQTVSTFSERDGLPDHVVHGIEQDSSGIFWISTDNGLCRLDNSTGSTWTFTTADGLLDNRFTPFAHCNTRRGELYFGSLRGIISFNPLEVSMHSELVDPVISGMEVNGAWRSVNTNRVVLKPDERDIAFIFSCQDYVSADNGKFFYKLDGVDADWCEAGKDWRAVYLALRPGDYAFRLKYQNSAGQSSDSQALIHMRIRAPWYKTSAARIILAILSVLAFFALFIWMLSRKDKQYKAQIKRERSELLRSFSLDFVKLGANKNTDNSGVENRNFNESDEALMRRAMNVAKENLANPDFSIDDFAAQMLMSRSNLNIRMKALFGVSPLDFVKTVRFNEACRLLLEGKYNVAEISYRVGFATPSYFTAAFRHFMGCTPSQWLKDNKKSL